MVTGCPTLPPIQDIDEERTRLLHDDDMASINTTVEMVTPEHRDETANRRRLTHISTVSQNPSCCGDLNCESRAL
jgi:hypothetical protein